MRTLSARESAMTSEDNTLPCSVPVVPNQKTLALINTYIASTTKALNEMTASCEQTVHRIDRRYEQTTYGLSLPTPCSW